MSIKYYNDNDSGVEFLDEKVELPSKDERTYKGTTQLSCTLCKCDLPGRLFAADGSTNYCVYCYNTLNPNIKNSLVETTAEARTAPIDADIADMFSKAMDKAIDEGKGWKSEAERQAYLDKVGDDDFLPAIFCTNEDELAKAPDAGAFSELLYAGETPTGLMLSFKEKGNKSVKLGRQNEAKNVQYYRDAINHYLESIGWCDKIVCVDDEDYEPPKEGEEEDDDAPRSFTRAELTIVKSTLFSNKAMTHMELKNWGFVVEDCEASVKLNPGNVKSWYRLAKARQKRKEWELCAFACDEGLKADKDNAPLKKLSAAVAKQAMAERNARQKKERERVKRVGTVKSLWKWCKEKKIKLGRVPLVATLEDEEDEDDTEEKRWNHVQPHFGKMPAIESLMEYTFPAMFLYPTVGQSDFVEGMAGGEMIAMRLAEMFPEEGNDIPWDHSQMFKCSNLAIYFEVHQTGSVVHPHSVRVLEDMKDCMRFFENARALKGADGLEAAEKAREEEREKLAVYRDLWKKEKGRWQAPADVCDVVQVHPAATLERVLLNPKFIAPNFLVNFLIFPQDHESHKVFLKERRVVAIVQPE